MPAHSFLTDFVLVLTMATLVAFAFQRAHLPGILGYLLAGVIIGPFGLGWLTHGESIHRLAELGVMLLMFTIGLEFSLDRLKGVQRIATIGGALQILISIGMGIAFARWQGWTLYQGFFLGSVVALSSSAIVLKYLIDRGEIDTLYGRIAVAILVFQDLAVAPLIILTHELGQPATRLFISLGMALLNMAILLVAVVAFARYILPFTLHRMAAARNREIFFLMVVAISSGAVWLSHRLALSPAIGAFLAGFMFANTDFRHQLAGDIVSFRHLFVSIFFVSLGLLFDFSFVAAHAGMISAVVGLVLIINFVVMTFIVLGFQYSLRVALASGLMLSQIGEFSFILIESAWQEGRIEGFLYHTLLSVAFITMLLTPVLFAVIPYILKMTERIRFFGFTPRFHGAGTEKKVRVNDHIIVCGFGPPGRNLAMALQEEGAPFIVLDMNPANVIEARREKMHAIYGDATNEEVLARAGIDRARAVVVSFGDSIGMPQIVRVVTRMNDGVMVIVRTRYEREVPRLYEIGADVVIMDEVEASLELTRLVFAELQLSEACVRKHLDAIRSQKELAIEQAILRSSKP